MKRMPAVLVAVLAAVLGAVITGTVPAAAAGGWAATYLDPLPERFDAGKPYALGFWVLQHGNHPFEGDLGAVGLRFTSAKDGKSLLFGGTALPEAGHYAASVVVPQGEWRVEGVQGIFEPYFVGTLTVPGGLRPEPVRKELIQEFVNVRKDYWDAVRPPGFPDLPGAKTKLGNRGLMTKPTPETAPPADLPAASPAAPAAGVEAGAAPVAASASRDSGGVPAYTLLLAAAGGAVVALAGLRLLPRSRRKDDEGDRPADPSAETIVISG
jgi:hypothetical protein